jgi:hypothetical protein
MNNDINFINSGGLNKVLLIEPKHILNFPDVLINSNTLDGPITINPSSNWYEAYSTDNEASFQEASIANKATDYWENQLSIFIPSDSPTQLFLNASSINRPIIADITDKDGFRRIVGTPDHPLRVKTTEYTSGKSPNDRKGSIVTFSRESPQMAYFYQPDVPSIIYSSGS